MKRLVALILAVAALVLTGCSSGGTTGPGTASDPFVGRWESTGGEQLSLVVAAPTNGKYPVKFTGGTLSREMTATRVGDGEYEAEPKFAWKFHLVDDTLMNVTIAGAGQSATTSFKRVGD